MKPNLNPNKTPLICVDLQAEAFTGDCTLSYVGIAELLEFRLLHDKMTQGAELMG